MESNERTFNDIVDFPPTVSLVKGKEYCYIPMEDIIPENKYVTTTNFRAYKGGGAKFKNGDIIFARITPCLEHGKIAKVKDLITENGFGSTEYFVFRAKKGIADPDYVYYLSKSRIITKPAIKSMTGASGRQRANKDVVAAIKVKIPKISYQENVASILNSYDNLIHNNIKRIELLEKSARLLYNEWFVYLRFPGHEHTKIVDGVPAGWEKQNIGNLGDVITGKTPSTKEPANYDGDISFIKTPDMHGNVYVIDTEVTLTERGANTQKNKFLPENTLIVSCIGTLGVVSITSSVAQTNQQINAVIPYSNNALYYLYFAFSDLKQRLEAMGGGATMGNVNKTKFESLEILMPGKSLLKLYQEHCEPVFNQMRNLQYQNKNLIEARDLLLPRLMNGDIAV